MFTVNPRVQIEKVDDRFYYIDVGHETHGRYTFRLWISSKLITEEDFLQFPVPGVIVETEKGTKVLKYSEDYLTHYIYLEAGFRGGSSLTIHSDDADVKIYRFQVFGSPRGRLGISEGAIICIPRGERLIVEGRRSGRLYGAPDRGIVIFDESHEKGYKIFEGISLEEYREVQKELG